MLLKNQIWEKWSIFDDDGFCGIDNNAPADIKKAYDKFLQDRIDLHIEEVKEIIKKYGVNFDDELKELVIKYCKKYPKETKSYVLRFPETDNYDEFKGLLKQFSY